MTYFNQALNQVRSAVCDCPVCVSVTWKIVAFQCAIFFLSYAVTWGLILTFRLQFRSTGGLERVVALMTLFFTRMGKFMSFLYVDIVEGRPRVKFTRKSSDQLSGMNLKDRSLQIIQEIYDEVFHLPSSDSGVSVNTQDPESDSEDKVGKVSDIKTIPGSSAALDEDGRSCHVSMTYHGDSLIFSCDHDGKEYELRTLISDAEVWTPNDQLKELLTSRIRRGCLELDLDWDCHIFSEWAEHNGIGSAITIVGCNFDLGPVLWKTDYAVGFRLARAVSKIIDLDQFGNLVTCGEKGALGFAGEMYNFRSTNISIVQTRRKAASAADLEIIGFIIRSGEEGQLHKRSITIVSRDRIFENMSVIVSAYGGTYAN